MTRGQKSALLVTVAAAIGTASLLVARPAAAEVILLHQDDGWQLSTDGRVNAFLSMAVGTGIPDEPDALGAGTNDTKDSMKGLHSARVRNGFIPSVLGFTLQHEYTPNFKVTARAALWMNISGSRTKNIAGSIDPRELYVKIEGRWGSLLAGSDLDLFGRGGILVDASIAHNYGLGYPCSIRDASGGACGMVGFGAPFPGFDAGLIYATPKLGGLQLSLGLYDPATIDNASLNRAPLPRFEGEVKFDYKELLRVFASGFWQVLEGTVPDNSVPGVFRQKDLHVNGWGAQAGAMLAMGPIMLGGAAYQGSGFSAITYLDESPTTADATRTLRNSRGAFGLAALVLREQKFKIAGGAGIFQFEKSKNDPALGSPGGATTLRQNLGLTVGVYQTVGAVHLALEYFRAQHTWNDRAIADPMDATLPPIGRETPSQAVNFINAGATIAW